MQAVEKWLEQLGLAQYAEVFAENDVDLDALRMLAESDLEKLGVSLGHRKKLLKAVSDLSGDLDVAPGAPTIQASPPTLKRESISAEGERRQLTVLFCDMVGFTELANRVDPEVLQQIIRSYEDVCAACVTRYEGYVFQRLGDGIVAFFGYPLAHEGEAERAIRAGLEIIETLSNLDVPDAGNLAVRIGIATGLVVVASAEKGAVGETMNLASRLQGIAQPGSIVVSEQVQRLASGSFDYEDLGEQTLKGIVRPAHAYRIVGVSEAASRFEAAHDEAGLTPLVGREQELGLLMERWQLSQDGEGQVVLLSGEPGIGKSRILSALRERLESEGARAMRFQCSPYYINSAFWPSIVNFERALKFARNESPESKLDKLESLIVGHYQRPLADVRFIASMLSIPCDARYGELAMTPQKFKDETLRTLVNLTEAASRKQPSVLLFEDLHWADPTSLEVLDLMIDRGASMPLLIVLTHRPEFQSRWADHGHVISLNLSKLTRPQSAAMISRVADGKALPDDLLEQIIAKTDGVPLFVEELTKSILESGELNESADRYEYVGSARSVTIPATLRDSLTARLDQYTSVKEIAQIGAAIGREFSYELISVVAPLSTTERDDALTQLTDSGLALRRGTPPEATYTFKHALVQDAAYDSLLKSKRKTLHKEIAEAIRERFPSVVDTEPELLAHHYTEAGMTSTAIPYWRKAGELAQQRVALQEAISHFDRALNLIQQLPPSRDRDVSELDVRRPLGMAWIGLYGWAHLMVSEHLEKAYALEESLQLPEHSREVVWGLWVYRLATGRMKQSLPMAEQLLKQGERGNDETTMLAGLWSVVTTNYWIGEFSNSIEHADVIVEKYDLARHRPIADQMNHDPLTVALQYKATSLQSLGYPDQAESVMTETLEHARMRGHAFDHAWALYFAMAEFHCYRRDPGALEQLLAEFEPLVKEQGLVFFDQVMGPYCAAICDVLRGLPDRAVKTLSTILPGAEAAGLGQVMAAMNYFNSRAHLLLGESSAAISHIEKALGLITTPGWEMGYLHPEALRVKGLALESDGRAKEAQGVYVSAIELARSQKSRWWELRTSNDLARLWQRQGKGKEAHDLLLPVYNWFTEGFDTKDLKEAKALLDELA